MDRREIPYPPAYLEAIYAVRTQFKEKRAKDVIRKYVNERAAVVFSGKDSMVALHITVSAGFDVDAVINTYAANRRLPQAVIDELTSIAESLGARVIIHDQPWNVHTSFFEIISRTYGYDIIITGLRRRENRGHTGVTEYYIWGMLLNPIIDWTVAEVWSYIYHHCLPIPSPYRFATRPETPLQYLVF